MSNLAIEIAERGWLPDAAVRHGIRKLLVTRVSDERRRSRNGNGLARHLTSGPIAVATDDANRQHYEVPPRFFELVLGRRMKYSCGYWPDGVETLDESEEAMLRLTCERAGLESGMRILDLGCGWGSLALWIAEHYPASRVEAVSNSHAQREFIEHRARDLELDNLTVTTADVNDYEPVGTFDRVLSIEMFEHMRNYEALLERISTWLEPDGRLFVHIFCHKELAYLFTDDGDDDWMARHFFTGGLMPSFDLLRRFDRHLRVEDSWRVGGEHYRRTAEAWLDELDRNRDAIAAVFRGRYDDPERWIERWRLFFLACAELFGFNSGRDWFVGHYLLKPAPGTGRITEPPS